VDKKCTDCLRFERQSVVNDETINYKNCACLGGDQPSLVAPQLNRLFSQMFFVVFGA
jgi:hypothetical protein